MSRQALCHAYTHTGKETSMGIVAVIILLALLFAGVGLLLEGLRWALIIALVLLAVGAVAGFRGRSGASAAS